VVIKNFWSLQVDEAIVAEKIKALKEVEAFFPVNSQLKDIDLIVFNLKTHRIKTVQVKSSKSWKSGGDEYSGQRIPINKINPKLVDFFIFSCYFSTLTKNQRKITPRYVVIPTKELLDRIKKTKVVKNGICKFYFNVYKGKIADFGQLKNGIDDDKGVDYTKYRDNFKLLKT